MSQYPNYGSPNYYTPPVNPRPTAVTVLGIVGIIWGSLMLLCNALNMLPALLANAMANDPAIAQLDAHPVARMWMLVGSLLGLALALVLIIGSSGALMLRRWGRGALLVFAVLELLAGAVDLVIRLAYVNPIMAQDTAGQQQAAAFEIGQKIGTVFAVAVALAMPIWILIVMTRPAVKAAFASGGASDPGAGGAGGYYGGGSPGMGAPGYPPQAASYPPPGAAYPPAGSPPPPQEYGGGGSQYPPQGPYGQ